MPARYQQDRFWDAVADVLDSLELTLSVDRKGRDTADLTITDAAGSTRGRWDDTTHRRSSPGCFVLQYV
ncbi:hypothetical protein [Natrinema altunense]|uniref:Uncharacterized protein n=1 Tax=Natrinema altunense TaxID=222984 RepID=A0A482XXB5_9EURY|nr:hypothetical protein [Natrinema altunense]RZH67802.1 hypothetical protein ELS17_09685 [Natrinema altunense]